MPPLFELRGLGGALPPPSAQEPAVAPVCSLRAEGPGDRERRRVARLFGATAVTAAPVAALRLCTVRLPGVRAPLLLPGPDGVAAFARWTARLQASRSFAGDGDTIARLRAMRPIAAAPLVHGARPLVAVVVNDPRVLVHDDSHSARAMMERLERMGCAVVLVPPQLDLILPQAPAERQRALRGLVAALDGLVGPGGADVDPRIYGQQNRYAQETNYARDRFEADLALAAMGSELYMLGVCRSHQLWNAVAGGALVQDVQREGYSSISQNQEDHGVAMDQPFVLYDAQGGIRFENRVQLEAHSELARVVGMSSMVTNSFHHQAVERPGEGFKVVGWAIDALTGRATVEATERWNGITVQWHPELAGSACPGDQRLLETYVRRVQVCGWLRGDRSPGALQRVLERMGAQPALGFTAVDQDWAQRFAGLARRR